MGVVLSDVFVTWRFQILSLRCLRRCTKLGKFVICDPKASPFALTTPRRAKGTEYLKACATLLLVLRSIGVFA